MNARKAKKIRAALALWDEYVWVTDRVFETESGLPDGPSVERAQRIAYELNRTRLSRKVTDRMLKR
jgi:hypothetical protein